MKTLHLKLIGAAIAAFAAAAPAAAQDYSDRNDGLTHRVLCSNVPGGAGFLVPRLGYFVEAASMPFVTTDRIAGVIPEGMSSKDSADVKAVLASVGLSNFVLQVGSRTRDVLLVDENDQPILDDGGQEQFFSVTSDGSWCKSR